MAYLPPKKMVYNNIVTLFVAEVETATIYAQKTKNLATKTTQETSEIFTKVF